MRAIVFDFDGVIVDSEPLHWEAFRRVLGPLGFECDYATYLDRYVGFDDRDMITTWFGEQQRRLDPGQLDELVQHKAAVFVDVVGAGVRPFPGAVELIKHASAELPVAICSGALLSDIEVILHAVGDGLMERFQAIVTAEDVPRSKPDPACYRLSAERLGVGPGACVAIEDTAAGLRAAADAGLHTLGVTHTHPADQLHADRVVESLAGVTLDAMREWYGSA